VTGPTVTGVPDHLRVTVVAVLDCRAEDVPAFQRYEDVVLPLLARHDGRLERRLRSADGSSEVHVLSFGSQAAYGRYQADPDRLEAGALLAGVELGRRVLESLIDVR
jgi:hypothetical protein